jgi:hypothetical protein
MLIAASIGLPVILLGILVVVAVVYGLAYIAGRAAKRGAR